MFVWVDRQDEKNKGEIGATIGLKPVTISPGESLPCTCTSTSNSLAPDARLNLNLTG